MSSQQSDLGEFDEDSPANPRNSGKGEPMADRTGRPECGVDTVDGGQCTYPVFPGRDSCWRHIEDKTGQEQDHSHQLAIATAAEDEVGVTEETRCPNQDCRAPVPSMYLINGGEFRQCPECGHRED